MDSYSPDMKPIDEIKWCALRAKELLSEISSEYQIAKDSEKQARIAAKKVPAPIKRLEMKCEFCGKIGVYARGLCRCCYARKLHNGTPDYKRKKKRPKEQPEVIPWTKKLYFDVIGAESTPPPDLEESVMEVINTLPSREKQVILYKYRDKLSFRKIGNIFGVSGQWISQIMRKTIRTLRRPRQREYFEVGLYKIRKENEEKEKESAELFAGRLSLINTLTEEKDKMLKEFKDVDISFLDLNVRLYNCLMRSGIRTIAQVIECAYGGNYEAENLLKIKNLGRKSAEEIMEKLGFYLNRYGVNTNAQRD